MYFLIPREVSADTATLWIAAVDETVNTQQLQLAADTPGTVTYDPWQQWPPSGGNPRVRHREARVADLPSRQRFSFSLQLAGNTVAGARVTTLPQTMPLLGEKPFIVLLGSCFAHHEDAEGKVGNAFFHLPHPALPDVKFLAGDQVYLDSPWHRYLTTHSTAALQSIFLEHYVNTWSQGVGTTTGFSRLLVEGANFFSSDDHEYWNNAPNFAAFAPDTWTEGGRKIWFKAARELYCAFQTPRFVTPFSVPPVSFLIVDTRVNRDADRKNFMKASDLETVRQWVGGLQGPGVLVVGQPIFQGKTGSISGTFGDWNLPDFEQYASLAAIVGSTQHSLVVLTGDVHFGRVAHSSLRSGAELVEIISSPMSLVDEAAKGKWKEAPETFPATPSSASSPVSRSEVVTEPGFAPTDGHFLTIEFTRRGPGAQVRLRFWPVFSNAVPPSNFGKIVWERTLA